MRAVARRDDLETGEDVSIWSLSVADQRVQTSGEKGKEKTLIHRRPERKAIMVHDIPVKIMSEVQQHFK